MEFPNSVDLATLFSGDVIARGGDATVNRVLTHSTLYNRYLCGPLQSALVIVGIAVSHAKRLTIIRFRGLRGKKILLLFAISAAGPDAQLFAQMCLSFLGVVGGMALAYAGRNCRDPRRRDR